MVERMLAWLGAGVVAAGVGAALVAAPAVAVASTDSDTDTVSSSQPRDEQHAEVHEAPKQEPRHEPADGAAESADETDPSGREPAEEPKTEEGSPADEDVVAPADEVPDEPSADEAGDEQPDVRHHDGAPARTEKSDDSEGSQESEDAQPAAPAEEPVAPADEPPATGRHDTEEHVAPAVAHAEKATTRALVSDNPGTDAARVADVRIAAVPAPRSPTLLNIVGTLFFNVFDLVVRFFEGPPSVPAGSAVRVSRRTLDIDGTVVDADWYFPTESEPDKLIYLQHGAFARAGLYNTTAAELAERNNAIVVAPSITTNFFAVDGRALGNDPMHAAVARLFLGDREALTASAHAAGWEGELPGRFVIAGHSGGGQLAAGAAGWYAEYTRDDEQRLHDLAGVILLDTSQVGGAVDRGVRRIPLDIPVYAINAEPAPLDTYGGVEEVLAQARPGFVGVRLIGGTHSDAWRTTNALAELVVGLGTGFPKARNVEAAQILMNGWISDWFSGTHTGYYGQRGETITIDTPAGAARAYVLPGPRPHLTFVDRIILALFESTTLLASPPEATTAASIG